MHKLAALLLPLVFLAAHAQAVIVPGAIPGNFGVSESGAATYSIPIAIPPGTAGMEPKLSLNYSSQSGNGIAGVGWSLGGLSAITRCPQTIILDGQTRGVQLDANDRFCLDGQRLILTAGATYGEIGAEYRTEIESFSKVVSYGGTAGDPQYFKVWTKAGQIIEFGNTSDARVEAQGKTIAAAWAVNQISDTVGNYFTFSYFEDNANGEHRISKIDYTGNAAAGVAPYNAVEFQYETRPDPSTGYLAGSLAQATQRLASIQAKANGTLVMNYQLDYEVGTTTARSRLTSLTQCAAGGNCLAPTTFFWQEGEAASFKTTAVESLMPGGSTSDVWFTMGDMNGDGRSDALTAAQSRWEFEPYLGQQDGNFSARSTSTIPVPILAPPGFVRLLLADVNGDGKADPAMCGIGWSIFDFNGSWFVWNLNAFTSNDLDGPSPFTPLINQGFAIESQFFSQIAANMEWCIPADVNADGKADFVPYLSNRKTGVTPNLPNQISAILVNGANPFEGGSVLVDDSTLSSISFFQVTDINGDGYSDAIRYDPTYPPNAARNGELRIWTSKGLRTNGAAFRDSVSYMIDSGGSPSDRWFSVADVNGDGLGDMVLHTPVDGKLKVWLSQGDGTVTAKYETIGFNVGGTPSDTWFLMVDVNADGRADAVKYHTDTGNIYFALSNGDGTFGAPFNQVIAIGFNPTPTVGPNPTTSWFQPADVNGDGLPDWVIYNPTEGKIKVNLGMGTVPDMILTLTDGHGATRSITYKPLTDPSVYTKGSGAVYPEQDVQAAMYVVAETAADDGIGGQFHNTYRYEGARTHLTGRGFLGFKVLEQTDLQTGIVTRSEYSQTFPNIGTPLLVTRTTAGGVELSHTQNTPASKTLNAGKIHFPYIAYSKEQGKDLNGAVLPSTETWNTYGDDWGNLTQTVSQTSDGFKKTTDNTYINDTAKWHLGRLARTSVTSDVNGWIQTRVSAFEYHATTGLLTREIIEPDAANVQYRLDTDYLHDAFGNRKTVTVSSPATGAWAIATRSSSTTYDAKGQFPSTTVNALIHSETKTFDSRFGGVKTLTGPNALTTSWDYDGFGRKIKETRVDGTYTAWTYEGCDAACPATGAYRIVTQQFGADNLQAAPVAVAYHDRLNRGVRAATQGFDGRWIYKDSVYDNRGNVDRTSRPYYVGDPVYWIDHSHDDLNRLIQVIEPDDLAKPALIVVYNGLTVSRTNRKDQTTSETVNSQGQKVSVTNALAKTVTYGYDPFGNPQYITSGIGQIESMSNYDIRGRKIWSYTPDLRNWTYEYNPLGEPVKQTDAKLQVTEFKYDLLGRMIKRIEPGLTSDWIYDTAPYGKGKLKAAKTNAGYIRTYYYDVKGRPQLILSNLGAGNPMLYTSSNYDTAGRLAEQYYPSGQGVRHVYNAQGYLSELRKADDNTLYWQQNIVDAEGHITQETLGNGTASYTVYYPANGRFNYRVDNRNGAWINFLTYGYDAIGNVGNRYQYAGNRSEAYEYDALNRLTQVTLSGGATGIDALTYGAGGNITSKTSVGPYFYGANPDCPAGSNAGTHAVCKAGANTYTYDANGNLTGGGGRTIIWASWNMPASLTQSGSTSSWFYGPEHDRYKMSAPGRTTWYLNPGVHQGGHYEQTLYASGTVEHRTTIYGGGKPIGEVLSFDTAPQQTRYFHSDHQGSITAVTHEAGQVITRYRYDPWGKQTLVSGSNTGIEQTRQGHTGHEMLDGGLTHMNGRVYDPVLSRFVSADPIVQEPYNLQSLNRYSYVWNNPLGYTDPSGYFGWEISPSLGRGLFALGGIMFGAVLGPAGPIFAGGTWATTLASGALAGGVGGFIGSGGNAQAARQGALAGGLFAGAGLIGEGLKGSFGTFASDGLGRAALHAAAGCISASAGGGSCGTGAMTAGFTKFASSNLPSYGDFGNLVKYSVIGGTASVIGGGKFANGAMTGAWQYLFNEVVAKYNSRTGQLSVRDVQTGKEANGNFFSGSKLGNGAAKGYYYILEGTYGEDGQPRYRLEAVDALWGDDENNNSRQSLLRLHGPGGSIGCITACDASNWLSVAPLIQNTTTSTVQVKDYYWNPSVFGHQLLPRIPNGGSVNVRYYGTLHVE